MKFSLSHSMRLGRRASRRGSVMGLMAVLLPVLAILAAFCINSAQMQLTRTELMVATDAAARAGGRAFSETQSVDDARQAAIATAALNNVNDEPLQLREDDGSAEIEFGVTTQPDGIHGRYHFQKVPTSEVMADGGFASALRVHGRRDDGSLSGVIPLAIPGLLGMDEFETRAESVAMQVDRDISLVIDRSGSMDTLDVSFPPGSSPWSNSAMWAGRNAGKLNYHWWYGYYPADGETWNTYKAWAYSEYYELGEAYTLWESLVLAVDAFLDVLDGTVQEEQVSLASYASNGQLDTYLETDFDVIRSTVDGLEPTGATAIGQGMEEGMHAILHNRARPYAAKTMVVMTDGVHNTGISPVDVANNVAGQYKLTIHTVTFGAGADQQLMQDVAAAGGGRHYHASTGDELVQIFREIANNLPTILTQ